MSAPADGSPVPPEHDILRLPAPPKDFVPDKWKPTFQEFTPSEEDKSDAKQRNTSVRVSVWDEAITTLVQARDFRRGNAFVLVANVSTALAAGASAVVYDRLPSPESEKPGAAGHAGIEGLLRTEGEPRPAWRSRLQVIAESFQLRPD